jgi:fido (protein-threonine AMPylation protein)
MVDIGDLEEYRRLGEPEKAERISIWQAAIGLQQVDGLTPSGYLVETAKLNIDGEITIYEVHDRLDGYYKALTTQAANDRTEEADKVSARIVETLSEKAFTLSPVEYMAIHRRLFTGIFTFAGQIRDYNIAKDEWALNGETVLYAPAESIRATLDYDFLQEREYQYQGLGKQAVMEHVAKFVSGLWQTHAFGEGNTRTTAVFAVKYLRTLGFSVSDDLFAEHSWYFRNALVRANYSDVTQGVYATHEYLNRFFGNLLLGEGGMLSNREMLVSHDTKPK